MPVEKAHIEQFLQLARQYPVLDVRSPGEFSHAHIPGAYSLPLFTDEERRIVGTTYKQQSREAAIKVGLDYFGPRMRKMVEETEGLVNSRGSSNGAAKIVLVHCWRGGMRSAGVAWLMDLYGFKVYTLIGGYKFFRRWVLQQFETKWLMNILGGYTGSGKTELLKQLISFGEEVIDLESLANHKGSAFGNIGLPPQPSQEMFENLLAVKLGSVQTHRSVWLEDESQRIGTVNIPQPFWKQMRDAKIYFVEIPFSARLEHIVEEYGQLDKERVIDAIERIQKRLGGVETKMCIELLREEKTKDAFRILLTYYDRWYLKGLNSRDNVDDLCCRMELQKVNPNENAIELVKQFRFDSEKKVIDEPGYR